MTQQALLLVSETAQTTMIVAAGHAHPLETGGILVGVYADGRPWVTSAIEIASTDRGRHHYRIPSGATTPAVHDARRSDPRLGYLGDWHSHPCDVGPSATDLASLLLVSVRHPRHANPSLVVVRNTADGYTLDARRIVVLAPRVCELRLTGRLPPPTPLPR